jgi:uncharacterized membrane protein
MTKLIIFLVLFLMVWLLYRRFTSNQSHTLNGSSSKRMKNKFEDGDVSDGEFKEVE